MIEDDHFFVTVREGGPHSRVEPSGDSAIAVLFKKNHRDSRRQTLKHQAGLLATGRVVHEVYSIYLGGKLLDVARGFEWRLEEENDPRDRPLPPIHAARAGHDFTSA